MKFKAFIGADMSGSMGGITASRNRGGSYFRTRSIPSDPKTAQQLAVRSAFAGLIATWQTLTPAQRAGWNVYGQNVPKTNAIGELHILSGQNWFAAANVPRVQAGLAAVNDAPTTYNRGVPCAPEGTFLFLDVATGQINFTFETALPDDGSVLAYVGRPASTTTDSFRGPWRLVGVADVASAAVDGSLTISPVAASVWTSPYGLPVAVGDDIWIRLRVSLDDGRLSSDTLARTTVEAV